MAGFDKLLLEEKLIELGWEKAHDGGWLPPFRIKHALQSQTFNRDEAREIENALGDFDDMMAAHYD